MGPDPHNQNEYDVRFDWGATAAERLSSASGVRVVVDVLSFTTAVSVAVDRGIAIYPAPSDDATARKSAEIDAALAVGRREVTPDRSWSLSPAHLRVAPAPPRLVLPSPNGSTIAAAGAGTIVAVGETRTRTGDTTIFRQ